MNFLRKLYFALLYLLPATFFFSYYPIISLGNDTTMNFELSLPLIFLVLFDATAFLNLLLAMRGNNLRHFSKPSREEQAATTERGPRKDGRPNGAKKSRQRLLPGISDRKFFLFALFPLYATLSIFWSANPTRAILTAGVLWLTFFAVFAIIYITPLLDPSKSLWKSLILSLFISTAVVCVFCWIQCILDVMNVPREVTLLCPGCTYRTFGFPHTSGFAIEPQFMGNLLLAPTLLSLYLLANREEHGAPVNNKACLACALLFSSTLFLTLSRGAIYAFAIALVILFIFALIRRQKWPYLIVIPVVTFITTLTAQGIFSAVSPTSDTFISGTTKILHQLSLGIIDLRPQKVESPESTPVTSVENPVENSQTPSADQTSQFDGYIPESTNTRLSLNSLALQTWLSSPYYLFFGVGLGGAGVAMSETFPENAYAVPNAIVQNEGISLLLELGLVGIALILLALALAFIPGRYLKFLHLSPAETSPEAPSFWSSPALPFFLALIVAYLITLNFFSGLPNALHIYLLPPLLYLAWQKIHKTIATPTNLC